MKVQKGEELHLGTISLPFALQLTRYLIVLIIKITGGTSQLFSLHQFLTETINTSEPGFQNKELNQKTLYYGNLQSDQLYKDPINYS